MLAFIVESLDARPAFGFPCVPGIFIYQANICYKTSLACLSTIYTSLQPNHLVPYLCSEGLYHLLLLDPTLR